MSSFDANYFGELALSELFHDEIVVPLRPLAHLPPDGPQGGRLRALQA